VIINYKLQPREFSTNKTDEMISQARAELFSSRSATRTKYHRSSSSSSKASVRVKPSTPEPAIHVRSYNPPNWFTPSGVFKKRKQIEARGLPNFHKWRFITLTLNPDLFDSPLAGYLAGKQWMRNFFVDLRKKGLMPSYAKWCWKLEFQANGWPHWHLLIERKQKYTSDQLTEISRSWSLGRVNVEMVDDKNFSYNFKYAFKPVLSDSDEEASLCVPDWFSHYRSSKSVSEDVSKPITFSRVRFWQTSKGFYTRPLASSDSSSPVSSIVPFTVFELLSFSNVLVISRNRLGEYQLSSVIPLSVSLSQFWNSVGFDCVHGGSVGLACGSFIVPTKLIQTKTVSCHLHKLIEQNSMTLQKALVLQRRGETLLTC
jgi:hypothetical protein